NQTQVREDLLAPLKRLTVVGRLGVGLDNIDLKACEGRGIAVVAADGGNEISVAEHVFAGLLAFARNTLFTSERVAAGEWPRTQNVGSELFGKTLGIVGLGRIGRQVARRAAAFGLSLIACDPFLDPADPVWRSLDIRSVELVDLLAISDFITLHCPLNDSSRGMIDAIAIKAIRPGAVMINTARGGIVDEDALAGALAAGSLKGALIDVFADEPLPAGNPFAGLSNVILTAHVAGLTEEAHLRVSRMIAERVIAILGEP
ncbi:MAG TPA: 3-phosphoglycerate dehydrogenase, partial [Rhodospirillaceae bacterium]|nr:3-phosphoglycerate dehydrogenase [Rhodospirillaceae bacterium]